jgi:hypothetical protein
MKTCPGCQAEMAVEAKRCPQCGADQRSWSGRHKKLIAVLLCLGLVLGLVALKFMQPAISGPSPQVIAEATQIAQDSTSGVLSGVSYDNCGLIFKFVLALQEDAHAARESERCLWQHYQHGRRAMLTVEATRTDDGETTLFAIDPANRAAPIHVETTSGGINFLYAGTTTCRALRRTGSGLQVEGCGSDMSSFPVIPKEVQDLMQQGQP